MGKRIFVWSGGLEELLQWFNLTCLTFDCAEAAEHILALGDSAERTAAMMTAFGRAFNEQETMLV